MTRMRQMMEIVMRLTPPTLALGAALLLVSSIGRSDPAAVSHNATSLALAQAGDSLLAHGGDAMTAVDDYETALAVDPTNRAALVGLARAALAQGLPGKSIHYYRQALALDPNNVTLLEGQGEAMVAKGAFAKANENLAKIKTICLTTCPEQVALGNAIAHGTAQPAVSAAQIKISPVLSEGESKN